MYNIRSRNGKFVSLMLDVQDVAKAEELIKGKTVAKQHFGYTVQAPMLVTDFIRMLFHEAVAGVKETAAVAKRIKEIKVTTDKIHKRTLDSAVLREKKKIEARRDTHRAICLTSSDAEGAETCEKCYDPKTRKIILGNSNKADAEVSAVVREEGRKRRKYLLVPLTAEWRDKLLTVKKGKVAGHADRIVCKFGNGEEWVWGIRDVRVGNVSWAFRAFSPEGAVPSKGIVPTYFAVLFKGWSKPQFPSSAR